MKHNQQSNFKDDIPPLYFSKKKIEGLVVIGLLATIAFDLVAYADIAVTGLSLEIPNTLGELVLGKHQYSELVGHLIHTGNGIGLSLLFGFVVLPMSKKIVRVPTVIYGIIFAIVETIMAVWFVMFPLLGAGVAGLGIAPEVPTVTMLRHVAFGIVLGILVSRWQIIK